MSNLQVYLISSLIFISFFSESASKDQINDLIVQAHEKMREKDFKNSRDIYISLLAYKADMNLSQQANTLNGLLELSYILNSKDEAKKYGKKLLTLIKNEPAYTQVYERLKFRICSSQDWSKFQFMFSEHCD